MCVRKNEERFLNEDGIKAEEQKLMEGPKAI